MTESLALGETICVMAGSNPKNMQYTGTQHWMTHDQLGQMLWPNEELKLLRISDE